ncbi:MAG: hypothetical protein GYB64_08110 [Chloroflexi bacterium]|nr:hypothetical protein [Chloroflexota bacterium]
MTALHKYIEYDEHFYAQYERYRADAALLAEVAKRYPKAHVMVVSRLTCSDCAREVPRMARIAEYLPGWTWEIIAESNRSRRIALGVSHVPTFIVTIQGEELGRIVERPGHGSLEAELLHMTG